MLSSVLNGDVAHRISQAVRPTNQTAPTVTAAAHACAQGDGNIIVNAASSPEVSFSNRDRIGVILHGDF